MEVITKNAKETQKFAYEIADRIVKRTQNKEPRGNGTVVALSGDLGAGKTTFVQGFAKALDVESRIISPTFILMRRYPLENGILYHLDAYRIDKNEKQEVESLGLPEIWNTKGNIVLIEWAEKIAKFLPEDTIWIEFEYLDEDTRKIICRKF